MNNESGNPTLNGKDPEPVPLADYVAPNTLYFKTQEQFAEAVGRDFIKYANKIKTRRNRFLVGLAHGQSPSLAYEYILNHYEEIKRPDLIRYTFVNSPLRRQRDLKGVTNAAVFLRKLMRRGLITREHILGTTLNRENIEVYEKQYNEKLSDYLKKHKKEGLDYVFLATDPTGRVAGITRNSTAFGSKEYVTIVEDRKEKELTITPHFLLKSNRVAFLATKADKRRPLAWLYSRWAKPDESPGFLRFMNNLHEKLNVFVDDEALTWPQVEIHRKTRYGKSIIRVDLAKPYNEDTKRKLPVVMLVHGFLGLNSYDGLLASIPSHKYIAAAMHYGSIPNKLPISEYSRHVVKNIDAVVSYFGSKGHPVYLFDHSMGNIYFLMMDHAFNELKGIKQYLRGRIGSNPFFGEESKHAMLGFLDNVLIPSASYARSVREKALFVASRRVIPLDTKKGVRKRGIKLTEWLISKESSMRDRIWKAAKERILYLMSNLDSLPHLNRIPIEQALNKLPAKIFAIQVHSALLESKAFDNQKAFVNVEKKGIPILILKSERDIVAKYVPRIYEGTHAKVIDITNHEEKDLFREHLYHMIHPLRTTHIIDDFVTDSEKKNEEAAGKNTSKKKKSKVSKTAT